MWLEDLNLGLYHATTWALNHCLSSPFSDPSAIPRVRLRPNSFWKFRQVRLAHIMPKHLVGPNHRYEHGIVIWLLSMHLFVLPIQYSSPQGKRMSPIKVLTHMHTHTVLSWLGTLQEGSKSTPYGGKESSTPPYPPLSLRRGNSNQIGLVSKTPNHGHLFGGVVSVNF